MTISTAKTRQNTGVALVLTLGMLVLLSGVVLAFLLTVKTEYGASKGYEGGTNARLLADTALNLVIGQIREASTKPDEAWISQPGLVRTFDQEGKPAKSYKLYSADSLVEDGSFDPAKGSDLPPVLPGSDPGNWKNQPGLWVDMNQPGIDLGRPDWRDASKKLKIYPIFDGNHIAEVTEQGVTTGQMSLHGKIDNATPADIEGFKVEEYKDRQVTMPVKWLYILKDGTLVPAKASGTKGDVEVVVLPEKQKTAQGEANTVVGRVAFWTDDETAKVNINTASEGTYWDTPVALGVAVNAPETAKPKAVDDAMFEWDFAARQGAQKEYQRYPGHPASTCLSVIFGSQLLRKTEVNGDRALMAEEIFKFIPRVTGAEYEPTDVSYISPTNDYSSRAGTVRAGGGSGDISINIVKPDGDRLYASIDEFLYNSNFLTTRRPWTLAPAEPKRDTTREMLEMAKFFLTASSKAPEQNLFNLPRVSVWPEQVSETRRTAFDKLIAFCSTVGPKTGTTTLPFYFTRKSAGSSGMLLDANGVPTGLDPNGDLSTRNLALMAYLRKLAERPIPGWDTTGSANTTFLDKYGADKDQILTEIFDYIRCVNLADQSDSTVDSSYTKSTPRPATGTKYAAFPPDADHTSTLGEVVPILMAKPSGAADGTRGIGRILTISEIMLVATRLPDKDLPTASQGASPPNALLQFALIPKFFTPMAGYVPEAHGLRVSFSNIKMTVEVVGSGQPAKDIFNVGGKPNPQPTLYQTGAVYDSDAWSCDFGGTVGWSVLCNMAGNLRGSRPDSAPPTAMMVASAGTSPLNTLKITNCSATVTITGPAQATPTNEKNEPLIQKFDFRFPDFEAPMPLITPLPTPTSPNLPPYEYIVDPGIPATNQFDPLNPVLQNKCGKRFVNGTDHRILQNNIDVVRSLVLTGNAATVTKHGLQGDVRLIAARKDIPETYFKPSDPGPAGYGLKTLPRNKHSMRQGAFNPAGSLENGGAVGFLVAGLSANGTTGNSADVPYSQEIGGTASKINGVLNSLGKSGDWDTGPFWIQDGPYCNKPDEGTAPHNVTSITPYFYNQYEHQNIQLQSQTFFSPNRLIPSAVMFGSLPTGVMQGKPWQTLLFRPAKYYLPGGDGLSNSGVSHPGSAKYGPPDHLLLDLFWMPVVEPYAISEPFATSGKINLNQQIAPFTNIKRDTGLRAVLKSVKITALNPDQQGSDNRRLIEDHKNMQNNKPPIGIVSRRSIDRDNTLKQITDRLAKNKPFVSASEICDIPLVPMDVEVSGSMKTHIKAGFSADTLVPQFDKLLSTFWEKHKLTGDNALERPYALLYPRLTTRSNSYTVHVRVQTLAQNSRTSSYIIKASQGQPTGEFRGSFLIERYLDANSANILDATGQPASVPASGDTTGLALGPYRFRIVSSKQFVP